LGGFTGAADPDLPVGSTGNGFIGLTGGTPLGTFVTGGLTGPVTSRADVILGGNGAFIKGHQILVPASLVLMPPSLTSVVNRWPIFNFQDITLGHIRDRMVRASRIFVTVYNVNNKGHSFVYEADLVGVDGAGDIAILRINYKKQWNFCNPCIEPCHPCFDFGNSREARDGDRAYVLGDFIANNLFEARPNAQPLIQEGLVADHRFLEHSGWVLPETVLVTAMACPPAVGMPILNGQGQIIAMQTTALKGVSFSFRGGFPTALPAGQGFVAGPSEFFMRRVVGALLAGNGIRNQNQHVQVVCDPAGSYYRYTKAYLGIAYEVMTGIDYDVTRDYTPGDVGAFAPRVRIGPNGEFLNSPSCKEIIGLRVVGVAGANPDDVGGVHGSGLYVPGGESTDPTFLPDFLPISPMLGRIQPGDIITHVNNVALGDLGKQIALSLVTWRLTNKDQLEITYRRGGSSAANGDNAFTDNYDNLLTITTCLAQFPPLMDYPWYAVESFPLLSHFLGGFSGEYPGFFFPPGQIQAPQLPARTVTDFRNTPGFFHPAL